MAAALSLFEPTTRMIALAFEQASERYPAAVSQIVHLLRESRSRSRRASPEHLDYYIEYGRGIYAPHAAFPTAYPYPMLTTPEEYVSKHGKSPEEARELAAMLSARTRLFAQIGYWRGASDFIPFPPILRATYECELESWLRCSSTYDPKAWDVQRELMRFRNILGHEFVAEQIRRAGRG